MPLVGDWKKAARIFGKAGKLMKENVKLATKRNAGRLRDQIKRTIRGGRSEWKPNSPLTSKSKGSSKPLIDHGDLFQAISSVTITPTTFFVGIPLNKGKMVMIATVHEYGKTIRPRNAAALTIPVSRYASELARQYNGVRNIPGLFRPKGTSVLAQSAGHVGFTVLFILKKEVVIPPRPFIEPSLDGTKHNMKREWEWAIMSAMRGKRYVARR